MMFKVESKWLNKFYVVKILVNSCFVKFFICDLSIIFSSSYLSYIWGLNEILIYVLKC